MPLYEYVCEDCSHSFETLVYDGESVACPSCQGVRVERQLSMPAKPRGETSSLPMGCDSSLPPCGPACRRWPG